MTAWPNVYLIDSRGYRVDPDDGSSVTYADGGRTRIRRLYAVTQYDITFRAVQLKAANVQAIRQFYQSYRNELIEWTDPYTQEVYDVHMTEEPRITSANGIWTEMEIKMRGTRQ